MWKSFHQHVGAFRANQRCHMTTALKSYAVYIQSAPICVTSSWFLWRPTSLLLLIVFAIFFLSFLHTITTERICACLTNASNFCCFCLVVCKYIYFYWAFVVLSNSFVSFRNVYLFPLQFCCWGNCCFAIVFVVTKAFTIFTHDHAPLRGPGWQLRHFWMGLGHTQMQPHTLTIYI